MTHLGVYYCPEHHRQSDRDYVAKLNPPVIRLLDPDVQQIADMHALVPGAIIAPRTWAIDDNNGAAVHGINADPVGTGRDHAQQYRGQLDRWKQEAHDRGLTLPADDRIYFNAANEPNQGGEVPKIASYTVAFLDRCTELNIRATALCLGVGWPDNSGPDTPVNWNPYAAIVEPIKRGSHWLELHEYHYKDGPQNNWTWWAGRHLQCPFDVPILLGEIGCDNYVDRKRWEQEGGNRGWLGNMTPDQYADMVQWHIVHSDTRVVAALVFLTDYRNNEWRTFDTDPAHSALIARKDACTPQGKPMTPTPPTPPTTTTMYVSVPSGARIRSAPVIRTDNILTAVPYGEPVIVTNYTADHSWADAGYKDVRGWMSSALLSSVKPPVIPTTPPVPTPIPPAGDKWTRTINWVLQWEGGYQNSVADKGNWTGCAQGKGENKGTNFGISACSYPHLDIKNLTKQQAIEIYQRDYWVPSGASELPWPYCLLVMDTAVLHGIGAAKGWLATAGPDPYTFAAKRLQTYTVLSNWDIFGKGWVNRTADLLEEMST